MNQSSITDKCCGVDDQEKLTSQVLPSLNSWGLWDQDGERDEIGTLNLLTPDIIKKATKEVCEGISISLNLALNHPSIAVFNRQCLEHTIRDNSAFSKSQSFDDTVCFNTQCSSQWDGLRHIALPSGLLYNGVKKDEVTGPQATTVLGLHKWHERGCVVGRGILVDLVAYALRHSIDYDPTKFYAFTSRDLSIAIEEQGVTIEKGDILLVRVGFIKWYKECSDTSIRDAWFLNSDRESAGVPVDQETISWVWNHQFSAVAGDSLAWEALPQPENSLSFHEYLIPAWGTPIGELFDLEELALQCQRLRRFSFMLVSVPLNIPGGVASPPNAIAIL